MSIDHLGDMGVILVVFFASLVAVFVLFRYMRSTAETSGIRISGALVGFLAIFALLYFSYWRLFERTPTTLGAVLVCHFMSLGASWFLFKKLESTADFTLDKATLKLVIPSRTFKGLRLGGAFAGYVLVFELMYGLYAGTIDRPTKLEYAWHQEPGGPAVTIGRYFDGVTRASDCQQAYKLLSQRLIDERIQLGQIWTTAADFCKYFATNSGHWNIAYKRLTSPDEKIRYQVALDYGDKFLRNELAAVQRKIGDYPGLCSPEDVSAVLKTSIQHYRRKLSTAEEEALRLEVQNSRVSTLIDPGAVHYYLRKLKMEREAQDAISYFQQMTDADTNSRNVFQLKIFTLVADRGSATGYKIDRVDTPLTGLYSGNEIPQWRF